MRTIHCLLLCSAVLFCTPQARALNIIWESLSASTHPDNPAGSFTSNPPAFDSDSSGLLSILEEVEREFQAAFEDAATIRITYWWDNAINGGQSIPSWIEENPTGTLTHSVIRFGSNVNYFIDPTPANDSEYAMEQVLYNYGSNALTPLQRISRFTGNVPDVFEAGYNGTENSNRSRDLLTLAFQEVGHSLGMNAGFSGVTNGSGTGEVDDNDYDVDPDWVRNSVMDMLPRGVSPDPLDHLAGNDAVMGNLSIGNTRTRPSAADFFAIALTQGWTDIDLPRQDFLGGTNWSNAGNWMGNQVPGSADDAYVRSAINGSVLSASLTASVVARNLRVENRSNVDVNNFKLDIGNDVTVTGLDSDIFINPGGELEADEIFIQDRSEIQMTGGLVDARRLTIDEGAQLEGVSGGSMTIDVSQRLVNNGVIDVDGGAVMRFVSAAANAWDLDGAGDGQLFANGGNLIFDTGAVSDAFDGEMTVNAGFFLRIDAPWEFNDAVLDMNGGSGAGNSARIVGGTVTITGGTIDVDDVGGDGLTDGKAEFDAPVVITGGTISVGRDDTLDFDNLTTVENGSFTLATNAEINFDATTTIDTADFDFANGGQVVFRGATTHSFQTAITSDGLIRQEGDATIIGSMTVDGGTFDLDGIVGNSTISLGNITNNGSLTLNVDGIDTNNNTFNGTIETDEAGIVGALRINLTNPNDSWTMAGTLNLEGGNLLFQPTRVGGSKMIVSGTVNVTGGRPQITADTDFGGTGIINIASGSSELVMRRVTTVAPTADFNGLGTFVNGLGGDMTLSDGLDTSLVDLENKGTLRLGTSPGQVEVNGFVQTAQGLWEVEVGGELASEFDSLTVDSTAELAGTLTIDILGGFEPGIGTPFEILTAPFGVSGTFDTVLGGVVGSTRLGVLYETNRVRLVATFSADFDLDFDVDADDLAKWQNDFGGPGSDADGDGDSDGADFMVWQQQFGSAAPTLEASQAVPEPTSLALGLVSLAIFLRRQHLS